MPDTVLLVDAYSLIYRAFYAISELTGPDGQPVNAIYGFAKMLRKLLAVHRPTHMAVAFDLGAPRQRLAVLPSYKQQRPPTPPGLETQLPHIRELLAAMRLAVVEVEGEEADDIIATLATLAARAGNDVLIASSDKDFMQLVGPRIRLVRPDGKRESLLDAAGVQAQSGVRPDQITDLLALAGDEADNIPGVPGVGRKTAADLLRQFDNLDALLSRLDEVGKPKLREALAAQAGQLRRNRSLIALRCDVALPVALEAIRTQQPDATALKTLFKRCGFKSLLAELEADANAAGDLFASGKEQKHVDSGAESC
jgi:DNA polymerase-1